jgi:cellulose synthase/poly-beta-1,6-N-acetylglucosamine synthase-like glycosyltransferase
VTSHPFEIACLICLGVVGFTYAGYPVLIWVCSRLFGRADAPPVQPDDDLPVVSLLIAAHNEELDIEARILNALAQDYPKGKLDVVIASDGSTDGTNEIVRRYARLGVRLLAYPVNRGKAEVLNRSMPQLTGDIVVLSDANTHMEATAVRRLAARFSDPSVGVVCGKLVLVDPRSGRNVDGVYWRYETFLKRCESRLGALLGANGAIYAIRRRQFPGLRPNTLIDDFVIPLDAKLRSGGRIVYDPAAVAVEETPPTMGAEFRRRVRIGAGGYQSIGLLWPLLSPANGWVAVTFFCHKILRWLCPFFLIAALVANALALGTPTGNQLFAAHLGFYALAALGPALPARPRVLRYLRLPAMFVAMNLALLLGFFRWLFGSQSGTWVRTERVATTDPVVNPVHAAPAAGV